MQKRQEHVNILTELINEQKLSEALDYLESLAQEERNCWEIENLTGIICTYCGEYESSLSFYRRALAYNLELAEVYFNLANTYICLGKYEKAELMLKQCEVFDKEESLKASIEELREIIFAKIQQEAEKNRVLMISYFFPPLSGSGVFRSLKFAKYLPEMGWNPTVISSKEPPKAWNYRDDSMLDEIPQNIDVIQIPDEVSNGIGVQLSREKIAAVLHFLEMALRDEKEALRILSAALSEDDSLRAMLQFPCSSLIWAYEVASYIENNIDLLKYKILYTTSGPASAHLVGFYLKEKYGISWVADYRDPWTLNPYGQFDMSNPIARLLFLLERNLLKHADRNLVVDGMVIDKYCEMFEIERNKINCITNGYDEADFSNKVINCKKNEKFTICYNGLLYTNQRSMTPILLAIQSLCESGLLDLKKIKIQIVGEGKEEENRKVAETFGLKDALEQTGYISHDRAIQANLDSDMLLLFVGDDPKFKITHTGKIFEYLRSGNFVLALAPKDGAVDEILCETNQGIALLSTQIEEIKSVILKRYQIWLKSKVKEYIVSDTIKKYERRFLTMQLADVLYEVESDEKNMKSKDKYIVICTGGAPSNECPYTNMFAHKRVLQYKKAGLDVVVFGFIWRDEEIRYNYEGVDVICGGEKQLQQHLEINNYKKILIHFADASVFAAIARAGKINTPIIVWGHGYDVSSWSRIIFNYTENEIDNNMLEFRKQDETKKEFLRMLFDIPNIHFIFVSNWMVNRVKKFVGNLPMSYEVIHNYIDDNQYPFVEKDFDGKLKILSIKHHATRMYGNDLTAKAIIELSHKDYFPNLEFELYGRGQLFERNFGELIKRNFPNVHIYEKFLTSQEMTDAFNRNHVLLSPTRSDTQGVTSCEGMSAGLCVISCNTAAVPEFMNNDCAALVEFDNYIQIVEEIEYLYYHREEMRSMSRKAHERVKVQCGYNKTIAKEIKRILE